MPIKHTDGADYFSNTEVEDIVKERLRNVGSKVSEAEGRAVEAEKRAKALEGRATAADALSAQLEELRSQAEAARGGLTRFQAAAALGVTDADTIEALEAAHSKAMKGVAKEKAVDFSGYLNASKADPSLLPAYLRGVFGQPGAAPQQTKDKGGEPEKGGTAQQTQPQRPPWAPSTAGQQPVQTGGTPTFADKARGAKSLDELVALQSERRSAKA